MREQVDVVRDVERWLEEQLGNDSPTERWEEVSARLVGLRQRRAVRKARFVGVAIGFLATAAAGAGVQGFRTYFLEIQSPEGERQQALPLDADETARLGFTDDDGQERQILITPEMVDQRGAVRSMQWRETPAPENAEEATAPDEPPL